VAGSEVATDLFGTPFFIGLSLFTSTPPQILEESQKPERE
jgi:hypothetical protein